MNRISASALDLLASALAAMLLLYIVTLQEALLYTKSLKQKATFINISTPKNGCTLGVFYRKDTDTILPNGPKEALKFQPQKMGASNYQILLHSGGKGQPVGKLVVFIHECPSGKVPVQQTVTINVLGSVAVPKLHRLIHTTSPMMQLDLGKLGIGRVHRAWSVYQP